MSRVLAIVFPEMLQRASEEGLEARTSGRIEAQVRTQLSRVAEISMFFSPCVAFEEERALVWLRIDGCAHLHRNAEDSSGERTLATRLASQLASSSQRANQTRPGPSELGHSFRIAIADGPRLSAAHVLHGSLPLQIAPAGQSAQAYGQLPVEAWPVSEGTQRWLRHLGCGRIAQVQKLPPLELRKRLSAKECQLLPLLLGIDDSVLEPYRPVEWPQETFDFDDDVIHSQALLFVAQRMVQSLAQRLSARALGATALKISLHLHRILAGDAGIREWNLVFPTPTYRFEELFAVVRSSLEPLKLEAPATQLSLAVSDAVALPARSLDFFLSQARSEQLLPLWWAECAAALGAEQVGTLEVVDTWNPELRSKLVPWSSSTANSTALPSTLLSDVPEPVRWLHQPSPYPKALIGEPVLLRAESVEWWKASAPGPRQWRQVWVPWAKASAWVEEREGRLWIRGWVDA